MILFTAALAGLLMALGLFKVFFHDRADFIGCIKAFASMGVFSILRADYLDRWFASARLVSYLMAVGATGIGAYHVLAHLFPHPNA